MGDPLSPLFHQPTVELFRGARPVVQHGSLSRLPAWMRSDPLTSVALLSDKYRGALQIAQGATSRSSGEHDGFVGEGGQTAVSGVQASALLRLGLSVFFADLGESVPASRDFLREIEGALSLGPCMRLGAFVNAPGSGLPLHHDTHDQLLIHLIGEKTFSFIRERDVDHPRLSYSPSAPTPSYFGSVYREGFSDGTALDKAELETVVLRPGSCVFIPAGTWHRTQDQNSTCLSLTSGVRAPSRWDLVREALNLLVAQNSSWRAPVYETLRQSTAAPLDEVTSRLDELAERVRRLEPADLRQAWALTRLRDGEADSYPEELEFRNYVRLPGTRIRQEKDESSSTIRLFVRTRAQATESVIEFDAEGQTILDWLLSTSRAFSIEELAETFDEYHRDDLMDLVSRLARVGFLRQVPSATW